jgi:hypothetical protein
MRIETNHWRYDGTAWLANLEDYRKERINDIHCPICKYLIRKEGSVSFLNWSRDYNIKTESYKTICNCGVDLVLI